MFPYNQSRRESPEVIAYRQVSERIRKAEEYRQFLREIDELNKEDILTKIASYPTPSNEMIQTLAESVEDELRDKAIFIDKKTSFIIEAIINDTLWTLDTGHHSPIKYMSFPVTVIFTPDNMKSGWAREHAQITVYWGSVKFGVLSA